ncbi:hypothetical protein EHW97_07505 [Aeromicrobium camelliae]|uniref:Uncharacterized protein n=1 Tax=Aeromicrobium camelliae TaxID=1538144 RepID=A0A3N6X233_9ACTN|nr:hypothetical protein [Aeromicrobium camelliae]RQN08155.1 hypothetical protein EHW97_07505 [Aeromicrobium camelliae]
MPGALIPAQIADASSDSKAIRLALVMTLSPLVTIVVHPRVGLVSLDNAVSLLMIAGRRPSRERHSPRPAAHFSPTLRWG